MIYAFLLSKENLELALGELKAVLNIQKELTGKDYRIINKTENLFFVETEIENLGILDRLALAREVFVLKKEFKNLREIKNTNFKINNGFCVREKVLKGDKKDLDKKLSALIKKKTSKKINLENPENLYKVFIYKNKNFLCKSIWKNREKFEQRKNQFRPFKSPISIHPKYARVLVNLTEIKSGEKILDPFCGTGGFLIEGGIIGAKIYGSDIDEKMVEGTKKNLEYFGIKDFVIKTCDIKDIERNFEGKFDCIVTGLPYGIASKKIGKTTEKFLEKIPKLLRRKAVFTSNLKEISFKGKVLKPKYEIYIHKNLSNYIYVLN